MSSLTSANIIISSSSSSLMLCWCQVARLCLTLCDPMDCSPPGSSVHGTLQARIQEWVAISFSRAFSWPRDWSCIFYVSSIGTSATWEALTVTQFSSVQLSHVRLFAAPWTAAHQTSLSFTISQSLLKLMPIESVMPSNHLILCHPFSSCPQSFPASVTIHTWLLEKP